MNDINLIPSIGRTHMYILRKLGFAFAIISLLFVLLGAGMCIFGIKDAAKHLFFVSVLFCCLAIFLLYLGLRHSKISQSSVDFLPMHIQIKDAHGNIWREISYKDISHVQKERISGFFVVQNPDDFIADYICIYLHGCKYVPDGTHYAKLFSVPDFLPIAFNQEVYDYLYKRIENIKIEGTCWDTDS